MCTGQAGIVSVLQPGSLAQCNLCVGQAITERVKLTTTVDLFLLLFT